MANENLDRILSKSLKLYDKRLKFDKLLLDIADEEKPNFFNQKIFIANTMNNLDFGQNQSNGLLPPLIDFLEPKKYLAACNDKYNSKYKGKVKISSKTTVKAGGSHEVNGIMQYLGMCGINSNTHPPYIQYIRNIEWNDATIMGINKFFNDSDTNDFSMLHVRINLKQYYDMENHYFSVFQMGGLYRLIQSYGDKKNMREYLNENGWISKHEMRNIVNDFIILHQFGMEKEYKKSMETIIKNKLKKCFGLDMGIDKHMIGLNANYDKKWMRDFENSGLEMSHISSIDYDRFENAGRHMLDFMEYYMDRFKSGKYSYPELMCKRNVGLRYRIGYPVCLKDCYLKKLKDHNKWGYNIY